MFSRVDLFFMNLPFVFGFIVTVSLVTKADLELLILSSSLRQCQGYRHSHPLPPSIHVFVSFSKVW